MTVTPREMKRYLELIQDSALMGSAEHREIAGILSSWRGSSSYLDFFALVTEHVENQIFRPDAPYPPKVLISAAQALVPHLVGSALWANLGYPTFTLTNDFMRAALVTDFNDNDDQLNLPFPAFMLRLPENLVGAVTGTTLFIYPTPTAIDGVVDFHDFRMNIAREVGSPRQYYTQWNNSITLRNFLGGDETKTPDKLEVLGARMDTTLGKRARRLLANTFLYVNSNGGLPSAKILGAEVPIEREHREAPRFRIGRPIKLGPQIREAVQRGLASDKEWELMSRFIVRGHWKNQAHGPGFSEHRRRWIEPYWKGPETISEALTRTFEVS